MDKYQAEREHERVEAVNQCAPGGGLGLNYGSALKQAEAPRTLGGGIMGGQSRMSVRQRIDDALTQANYIARRADAALRAKAIIDAHPELAELLDALNEF